MKTRKPPSKTGSGKRFYGSIQNIVANNFTVISCRSALLFEEAFVSGKHHRPSGNHWQSLLIEVKIEGRANKISNLVCRTLFRNKSKDWEAK